MTLTKYAVLALLAFWTPGCDGNSHVQIGGTGNLVRTEPKHDKKHVKDPKAHVKSHAKDSKTPVTLTKDKIAPGEHSPHSKFHLVKKAKKSHVKPSLNKQVKDTKAHAKSHVKGSTAHEKLPGTKPRTLLEMARTGLEDRSRSRSLFEEFVATHSKRFPSWPPWEKYFEGNTLANVTFVQLDSRGSDEGDPVFEYASRHNWKGFLLERDHEHMTKLKKDYVKFLGVTPLEVITAPEDKVILNKQGANETHVSLATIWQNHVVGKYPKVDILSMDNAHAKALLLPRTAVLSSPKPTYILYGYKHLGHRNLHVINNNLEKQSYQYTARNGQYELHTHVPEV